MNFLTRFLKVFTVALLFSALGALVFYLTVMSGKSLRSDVSQSEYISTIYTVVGAWGGFIIFISIMLALTGMKKTISLPVYDRDVFLQRASSVITGLRYRPFRQTENQLIFKPPVMGGLLAEKISIQLTQGSANITAPRGLLRKIQEKLSG
jgi:hypothetical protein